MKIIPAVIGNWKMHGLNAALPIAHAIDLFARSHPNVMVSLAPPYLLLPSMASFVQNINVGGQDCNEQAEGAYTGEVSATMLADAGARFTILGHSERRMMFGDSDSSVRQKVYAAWHAGLSVILCVGETREERDAGLARQTVVRQLLQCLPAAEMPGDPSKLAVAYEPVWAIGTGVFPTVVEVEDMHKAIRAQLEDLLGSKGPQIRILYGGSVNPDNADALFMTSEVNGALVGGASLAAASFNAIIEAAGRSAEWCSKP